MDGAVKMHGGCHLGMPVGGSNYPLGKPGTGCRVDCLHRRSVLAYRADRAAWEEWAKVAREQATYADLDEGENWADRNPGPTWKQRLIDGARREDEPE